MTTLIIGILVVLIFVCTIPTLALLSEYCLAGLHGIFNDYKKCEPLYPRIAILIPAWNEAEVLDYSLDRLMLIDYPRALLRVYVIDDNSADHTADIVNAKMAIWPNNIFYIKREQGGQGKAHTLNCGLRFVLEEDNWAEAILIIDADVVFENDALTKMTRHFADPKVGAVTAYIKVSQFPGNYLTHCISSEYILSQAVTRRAQNVLGAMACLAGGAQLHTRANLERLGGKINTETLAEDTYTTFQTQLHGYRAVFEGNAIARAEEPDNLNALWKQRFRWARGNIQIMRAFKHIWFRRSSNLGGIWFGLIWFSTLLMPFAMILTSVCLILLFFIDPLRSWVFLRLFYMVSTLAYMFSVLLSYAIDSDTMKRAWFACLTFPGLISLCIMFLSLEIFYSDAFHLLSYSLLSSHLSVLMLMDLWVSTCMFFAWLIYRLAKAQVSDRITNVLLIIVGYGPLLCVITLLSFAAEIREPSVRWDKTEKKLPDTHRKAIHYQAQDFDVTLKKNIHFEQEIFWDELLIIIAMVGFFLMLTLTHYYLKR